MAQKNGTGMFPREVMNRFPLLPLEEEGRLNDMPLRENFIERVLAYYRWTRMLDGEPAPGGLVRFHTAHRLTLMAHSPKHYTEMGRLVADVRKRDWDELTAEYGSMLMEGLGVTGTPGKHVNILHHLTGFLKNHLSSEDKPTKEVASGPHRRLPAGVAVVDRALDAAKASLEQLLRARPGTADPGFSPDGCQRGLGGLVPKESLGRMVPAHHAYRRPSPSVTSQVRPRGRWGLALVYAVCRSSL